MRHPLPIRAILPGTLLVLAALIAPAQAVAEEAEGTSHAGAEESHSHRNHFAGIVGWPTKHLVLFAELGVGKAF